jgi:hypothetical protein
MSTEDPILAEIPDTFWELVDLGREDRERFRERVRQMDPEVMIDFCRTCDKASAELYGEPYLDLVDPALSEDGVNDLCEWVVMQGRAYYAKILADPASIPYRVDSHDPVLGITSDVLREYSRRYNKVMPL